MSNLDQLRQDVIDKARVVSRGKDNGGVILPAPPVALNALDDALTALDEAQKPDVWGLLRSMRNMIVETSAGHLAKDAIDSALAWRERNPE